MNYKEFVALILQLEDAYLYSLMGAMKPWHAAQGKTPVKISASTPRGPSNVFAELLKVQTNANSKIPFELYDYQKTILSQMGFPTEEATEQDAAAEEVSQPRRDQSGSNGRTAKHRQTPGT